MLDRQTETCLKGVHGLTFTTEIVASKLKLIVDSIILVEQQSPTLKLGIFHVFSRSSLLKVNFFFFFCTDSIASLPYSRATELGILIGIPMACSVIMLTVVAVLFAKSVLDSQGTYYAYGKTRNKDKVHSCLVRLTATIAHVGGVGYVNQGGDFNRTSIRSNRSEHSLPDAQSSEHSRPDSTVEGPEITITPGTPESDRRLDVAKVFASSSTSIEQDRFQSATSLETLVSKKYTKPKTRKLRSLRKADAVVTPAGAAGKYIKKEERLEYCET